MTIEHYIYLTPPFSTDTTTEIIVPCLMKCIYEFKPPNVPITSSLHPVYTQVGRYALHWSDLLL